MDDFVTIREHKEFVKRMDEANEKQCERLTTIETDIRQICELTAAVKELAVSMKGMSNEQEKQGKRLATLESRDGEMWRKVVGYVITAVLGIAIGFIFTQIGM